MRKLIGFLFVFCALAVGPAVPPVSAEMVVGETRVVPEDPSGQVVVRDVRTVGDTVSGVLVNRAPDPVRKVRLAVSHIWLWDNEMHPGEDTYSRAEYYVVPDEIPPGGQVPFTLRPSSPLSEGPGGSFMTEVRVSSFDVLQQPGSGSPTAGTRGVQPETRPLMPEGTTRVEPPARRTTPDATRGREPTPEPLDE
jgi:hypothetical protein